jgi:manganese efflux pump family protein
MDFVAIIGVAIALAMDAFSVCIACGISIPKPDFGHYFRLAFHFGLFQFMMPVIGYFGGRFMGGYIAAYDRWIAFGLLVFIGLKMIGEAFTGKKEKQDECRQDPSHGWSLVFLAVATSIDALAVGISLGVLNRKILIPSIIIGLVCSFFSIIGIAIGNRVGAYAGRYAEAAGGLMLIAIGFKLVVERILG